MGVMIEAKDQEDGSLRTLFTLEHFQAMIDLDNFILNLTAPEELSAKIKPESVNFYDLCRKDNITDEGIVQYAAENCPIDERFCLQDIAEKCKVTPRPLDFVYDRKTDSYDLS